MKYIIHRINKINDLKKIPKKYGCEIDIRTNGSKLILNHDAFKNGDLLTDYLDEYKNGLLVLNIKESGIEDVVLKEIRKRKIKDYFLLDVEFPYIYKSFINGEKNISLRYSELEPIENISLFANKFNYVWIDTITKFPIKVEDLKTLKKFKNCLVCPSRWGRTNDICKIKNKMTNLNFNVDFIMTDINKISLWNS